MPVLAATGRRAASAWPLMEANGIALPTVLLDGALGREFGSTTAFHTHAFRPEAAAQVLKILEELGVSPCINVDDPGRDVVLGENPTTDTEYLRLLEPWTREEDTWTAVRTLSVLAFTVLSGEPSSMRALAAEMKARAPVEATLASDRATGGPPFELPANWRKQVERSSCVLRGPGNRHGPCVSDRRRRQRSGASRGGGGCFRRCRRLAGGPRTGRPLTCARERRWLGRDRRGAGPVRELVRAGLARAGGFGVGGLAGLSVLARAGGFGLGGSVVSLGPAASAPSGSAGFRGLARAGGFGSDSSDLHERETKLGQAIGKRRGVLAEAASEAVDQQTEGVDG